MKSDVDSQAFDQWDYHHRILRNRSGGWVIGDGIYCRGYRLLDDLVGEVSYFQLLVLNAIGRLPERRFADWLENIFMCMSWPDPRIWCNQIGALAGTMQTSPAMATVMGSLAGGDSKAYGGYALSFGAKFIADMTLELASGVSVEAFVEKKVSEDGGRVRFMGFARPIARGDERVAAMESVAKRLGFEVGEHMSASYKVNNYLLAKYGESLNIGGYCCAFLLDQGLSADEMVRVFSMCVASGVTACYVEELEKPAGTFLPWRCEDIEYVGPAARPVPPPEA